MGRDERNLKKKLAIMDLNWNHPVNPRLSRSSRGVEITFLQLEMLDVSCNCISSLPLELRNMNSLVALNIDHNPLVSPPATVCVRGRIHIFKYLENQAGKDGIHRRGASVASDEHSRRHQQLRSTNSAAATCNINGILTSGQPPLCPPAVEGLRHKARYNVDSGYSTSDGGEKRWSSDGIGGAEESVMSGRSTPSTPSTLSPSPAPSHHNNNSTLTTVRSVTETPPSTPILGSRISPDGPNGEDKSKIINHQQTYRQYKEAQRQQRQQDVYRPRGETSPATSTPSPGTPGAHSHSTPNTLSHSNQHSPLSNGYSHRSIGSSSPSLTSPNLSNNNPLSPAHSTPRRYQTSTPSQANGLPNYNEQYNSSVNNYLSNSQRSQGANGEEANKRPVQKVVPSRSNSMTTKPYSPTGNVPGSNSIFNGNGDYSPRNPDRSPTESGYIKPVSPIKGSSSYMSHNNVPMNRSNSLGRSVTLDSPSHVNGSDSGKLLTTSVTYAATSPTASQPRINWNKDLSSDKLSFTMKREFDKAREESELIQQLRSVIENRLKMTLPQDLSSVLSDGVVLCHLANNVRPRAVASVHVPSPAQPKLTMARCRRNVDNFLDACRRIGVEEGAVCRPQDIVQPEDKHRSLEAVCVTVSHLMAHVTTRPTNTSPKRQPHATENQADTIPNDTNNQINYNLTGNSVTDEKERFRNSSNHFQKVSYKHRYAEDRCISSFNIASEIVETEEMAYTNDSDNVATFTSATFMRDDANIDVKNCNVTDESIVHKKPTSNVYPYNVEKNKINYVTPLVKEIPSALKKVPLDQASIVTKRVRFFNDKRQNLNLDIKNNLNLMQNQLLSEKDVASPQKPRVITEQDRLISKCCVAIFIASVLLLYLFPLPNN